MSRTGTIGWRCRQCGSINGLEAKFCRGCGAPASFGIPVDTSQRHTHNHQAQGAGIIPSIGATEDMRTAKNIEPTRRSGGWKMAIIILSVLLALLLLGFGVYMILRSDKNAESVTTEVSDSNSVKTEISTDNGTSDTQTNQQTEQHEIPTPKDNQQKKEISQESGFVVGQDYYVIPEDGVKVRNEPSTRSDGSILKKEQVPEQYRSALKNDGGPYAVLKQGTKVACKGMNDNGDWMLIADGCWVCIKYKGEELIGNL